MTSARIVSVQDKGSDKGALIVYAVDLFDPLTGCVIATTTSTLIARGDGGFGGPTSVPVEPAPVLPQRDADAVITLATQANQALLYRLSGEMNPLHADPDLASAAGFDRPILQGPCTFGMCLRAVLQAWPDLSPMRLRSHEVRYAASVVPGDTLTVRLWREGLNVLFEADVAAKGLTVIRNGKSCFFRP